MLDVQGRANDRLRLVESRCGAVKQVWGAICLCLATWVTPALQRVVDTVLTTTITWYRRLQTRKPALKQLNKHMQTRSGLQLLALRHAASCRKACQEDMLAAGRGPSPLG